MPVQKKHRNLQKLWEKIKYYIRRGFEALHVMSKKTADNCRRDGSFVDVTAMNCRRDAYFCRRDGNEL